MEAVTRYRAAKLTGVNESVFTQMWKRHCSEKELYHFFTDDGKIIIDDPTFQEKYYTRIIPEEMEKLKNKKKPKIKISHETKKPIKKKLILHSREINIGKTDLEIFIDALGESLADANISEYDQTRLKNAMIKNAEKIEKNQLSENCIIPADKKSYTKKTITATRVIERFAGDLLPEKGDSTFFVTTKQLNASAFLIYTAEKIGKIEELFMSYFRISVKSVEILNNLIKENLLDKAYIMLSELSTRDARPAMTDFKELCVLYPDILAGGTAQTHTKVLCFKSGGNYFTLSGSANMTGNNARIEQYEIKNDKKLYDFNKKWILNPETILSQKDCQFFGNRDIFK